MCARTTCRTCGKPTWSGCGQHVESALSGVPKADRCQGHARAATTATDPADKRGGFLSRLFGGQ
jgi:hypothetical protein